MSRAPGLSSEPAVGVPRAALEPKGDPSPNRRDSRPGGGFYGEADRETGEVHDLRRDYRRAAFRLRNDARRLLSWEQFKGLHQCGLPVSGSGGSVAIVLHPESGRAHWSGVLSCGSPWVCPVCSRKIGARRSEEIEGAVEQWLEGGGSVYFITLTVPHLRRDSLRSLMDGFVEARRRVFGSGSWRRWRRQHGVPGMIVAQEITVGMNGWHPHAHALVFVAGETTPAALHSFLFPLWARAVRKLGLGEASPEAFHVVEVSRGEVGLLANYLGGGPSKGSWGLGGELAGQVVKHGRRGLTPFELLEVAAGRRVVDWLSQEVAARLWQEYAKETKGRRHVIWSPRLRELFGVADRSDEEIANEEGEGEAVAEVSASDYLALRRHGLLAEPLELVEDYGPEVALTWIRWVVDSLGPRGPGPLPAAEDPGSSFAAMNAYPSGVRG